MPMGILGFKKIESHANISLARKLTPIQSDDISFRQVDSSRRCCQFFDGAIVSLAGSLLMGKAEIITKISYINLYESAFPPFIEHFLSISNFLE